MNTQFAPNSMSLPPPGLDLLDGERLVGWVRGWAVGFRGFTNENEAAGAAWVAYRALAGRLARRHGGRPAPIDVEPLSLQQDGDRKVILASGRPIATLVVPGADSLSGPDSFGFEIQVPHPADELSMRSLAHRIHRTLRKSGVRWALWEKPRVNTRRVARRSTSQQTTRSPDGARRQREDPSDESMRTFGWLALGVISIVVLLLAFVVPDGLAVGLATIGLVGLILFRLTAASAGWVPPRGSGVGSRSDPLALRRVLTPEGAPARFNGAQRMPSQGTAADSRHETSSRLLSY